MPQHENYMRLALLEAKKAQAFGEVPIGAVIIDENGEIISTGYNCPISTNDPSAHAEIIAIRNAGQCLKNYRLKPKLTLYVTLEPCTMCAGAISFARIENLVFGAFDKKGGAVINGAKFFEGKTCHFKPNITGGVLEMPCSELLKGFFIGKRKGIT